MTFLERLDARLERSWPTASLRSYLFAAMLVATLPLVGLLVLQSLDDFRSDQAQIEAALSRSAGALAEGVRHELDSSFDGLAVLSQSELFQQGRIASLGRLLQRRARGDWDSIFLLDRDGSIVLDTAPRRPTAQGLEALHALQRRAEAEHRSVSGLWEAPPGAGGAVAVAVPIVQNGRTRYVLGALMGEAVWQRLATGTAMPAGAGAAIFDGQDRLIASSEMQAAGGGARLPPDTAQEMREAPAGVHRASDTAGNIVYAAWHEVPGAGWRVQVALPAAPIDAMHRGVMAGALATSGACLLLGLVLAALVARRISRPLGRLAASGAAGLPGPVRVREIARLRDGLREAQARDTAAHVALQAKAQEFETLFDSSPVGMAFAQDPACRAIRHNAAMDALIGPAGPASDSVRVLQQGRVLAAAEQPLHRAAARGETVAALELEIAVDGRPPVIVLAGAVPLHDEHGHPRGALSAFVDITAAKQAQQRLTAADRQLHETQRQMELAQEGGRVGFFHYRFGADRLAWTPGQCKLFGVDELPDARLRGWFELIAPADRERVEREFWMACALRRDKETLEYGAPAPDGGTRWLSSRVMLQYDGDGRACELVGVTVDMTDQVETERARALLTERAIAARRDAEAASRAKDEFLTMLGHELRNPLGAIAAAVDVLEAATDGSPTAVEAREIIARQTRNLSHMMNDLLDVGRVIAGKILLARQPVNLAAVVRRVEETLAITGEAREHVLQLSLADAWIDGDAVRIDQVVTNLLTNALKYTPAGRSICVRVALEQDTAVLQVQDAGTGIPAALLPRVFDLFVQGERPLDRRDGGLGIGLTLVRRLVELHGGAVAVESSDQGSRFTVRLPATSAPESVDGDTLPPSRRRKVLVVEDNQDVMYALRARLELDGHTVSTAADGIAGLHALLKLKPEVSIVDIGLPGLTGFELARHARAAGYAGRMIAMSGYGAERDAQEALVAGFDAYLVKPIDRKELRATLSAD
jgi:signal transduction histidine kinase